MYKGNNKEENKQNTNIGTKRTERSNSQERNNKNKKNTH
ncbi:MAG: hypothetical protein K0R54_2834 [Clostridiaceae bacterium]|jgi:hypothetical protein|nr:hypothetical protein [Clostridiaceae bacterium]